MNVEKKRQREIEVVSLMIHLYCQKYSDIDEQEMKDYASLRINKCPRMAEKTFCSQCPIHCYQKEKQQQMKKIMRYSGPRMIFYHPILAIRHALKI